MPEILKNIWTAFEDRAKSKFWPTFTFVWAIHNWDFLYILLFSPFTETKDSVGRLAMIYNNHWSFIGVPVAITIFLVIAIPWVDVCINCLQKKAIFKNKTVAIDLAADIAKHKAEKTKKQAEAMKEEDNAKKEIKEIEAKDLDYDQITFRTLDAILNESNIREIQSRLLTSGRFYMMPQVEKYLIEGEITKNRFKDLDIRNKHKAFIEALNLFKSAILEQMHSPQTNGQEYIIIKDFNPPTGELFGEFIPITDQIKKVLSLYLKYREEIKSRYDE